MSADVTEEVRDLLNIYANGAKHFATKQENITRNLVHFMKEFCSAYEERIEMEQKYAALKHKLGIDEEEGDDE
jgi:hypothetical protein